MYTVRYDSKVDNWNMLQVLKKREMPLSHINGLPRIGIVVYEEDHFIAAGFLRTCEGGYALLDSYISDPTMPPSIRDQALDMITKRLVKIGDSTGYRQIITISLDSNTLSRSQRHGFIPTEYKVLVRGS